MFTVELGLRNSNPIDSALTVYRIQKQWSRNPETVISEFGAGCRRGCARLGSRCRLEWSRKAL